MLRRSEKIKLEVSEGKLPKKVPFEGGPQLFPSHTVWRKEDGSEAEEQGRDFPHSQTERINWS